MHSANADSPFLFYLLLINFWYYWIDMPLVWFIYFLFFSFHQLGSLLCSNKPPVWVRFILEGSTQLPIIERVQRRFLSNTSHLLNIFHPSHDNGIVLHELGLLALADKRVDINLKCIRNLIDGCSAVIPLLLSFVKHTTNYTSNNPIHHMMCIANTPSSFLP